MICVDCGKETGIAPSGFCPNCGALLDEFPQGPIDPGPAQKTRRRSVRFNGTKGPLLTGSVAFDTAIGFLGEIAAMALLGYGAVLILQQTPDAGQVGNQLLGLGAFATGILMLWHTNTMRKRYPTFARGWQVGRDTWGKGVDHLLTLLFGIGVLIALFPIGITVCYLATSGGPLGIIVGLVVTYLFGMLVRRLLAANKRKGGPKP